MNTQHEVLTGARRVSIILTIVFLSIAAIIGIIALFTGTWSDLHTKILGTTLLAAALSVVLLVQLSIYDRVPKALFSITIILAVIAFIFSIVMMWYEWDWSSYNWPNQPAWYVLYEWLWRGIWLSWLFTAYFTHLSLLLIVKRNKKSVIQVVFWLTLLISTTIAGLVTALILTDGDFWFENLDRILGALLILWVLGTIVMPILGRVLRSADQATDALGSLALSQPLIDHLLAQASVRGLSVEQYLHTLSTTNHIGSGEQP